MRKILLIITIMITISGCSSAPEYVDPAAELNRLPTPVILLYSKEYNGWTNSNITVKDGSGSIHTYYGLCISNNKIGERIR